ncbi:MAG: hypothetical protein NC207_04485 [Bacteroides sp.]|nr:hypothetical protein [Bacteroides sp.]
MGMPVSGVDALRHTRPDSDGVVMEGAFACLGRRLCIFLQRPQDYEGSEMGWRRIFDVHETTVARPVPGGAEKGR